MLLEEHRSFLESSQIPMRLGLVQGDVPLIVPLWFVYEDGCLWCASHELSYLVRFLRAQSNEPNGTPCSFDISTNDVPYRGVAGTGRVRLDREHGSRILAQLAERYLGDVESNFARWLLSRAAHEEALCVEPTSFRAWDFSHRMTS